MSVKIHSFIVMIWHKFELILYRFSEFLTKNIYKFDLLYLMIY